MAKKVKSPAEPGPALPSFARIEMNRIMEPEIAARSTMDTHAMDELRESLAAIGQIEPISLEQHEGMYEIITGHRRFLAARELRWTEIAALVYPEGSARVLAMRLHENAMREALNPAEEALWMAQVRDALKLDEDGLCQAFNRSADYIASRFALLRGDPEIFGALQRAEIRVGVAHELNRITDEGMRRYYLDCARRSDPPQRVVKQWVADWQINSHPQMTQMAGNGSEPGLSTTAAQAVYSMGGGNGAAVAAPGPGDPGFFGCALCGGDRDPYNLVQVMLHKWEWQSILDSVARAGHERDPTR